MNVKRIVALGLALALSFLASAGVAMAAAEAGARGQGQHQHRHRAAARELPGVGAKLAARIVEYRQKAGGFKSAQELMNVQGVGEKNFARLQPHLTVGDERGQGRFQQVDAHGGGGPTARPRIWRIDLMNERGSLPRGDARRPRGPRGASARCRRRTSGPIPPRRTFSAPGQVFRGEFRKARSMAAMRGVYTALRFESQPDGWRLATYADGNGNGVRSADIAAGIDRRVAGRRASSRPAPATCGSASIPARRRSRPTRGRSTRRTRSSSARPTCCRSRRSGGATPGTLYLAGAYAQAGVRVTPAIRARAAHGLPRPEDGSSDDAAPGGAARTSGRSSPRSIPGRWIASRGWRASGRPTPRRATWWSSKARAWTATTCAPLRARGDVGDPALRGRGGGGGPRRRLRAAARSRVTRQGLRSNTVGWDGPPGDRPARRGAHRSRRRRHRRVPRRSGGRQSSRIRPTRVGHRGGVPGRGRRRRRARPRCGSAPTRASSSGRRSAPLRPGVEHSVTIAGLRDLRGREMAPHASRFAPAGSRARDAMS